MNNRKKKDPAAAYYGQIVVPDEYADCPICGKPVRWPWEQAVRTKNKEICHAACVEEAEAV